MKLDSPVTFILGVLLAIFGILGIAVAHGLAPIIPLVIGASLIYLGWRGGRIPLIVFGHTCIVVGCFMVTWGIYLLPYSQPTLMNIFARPFSGACFR